MFENIKECLNRFERIVTSDNATSEDYSWIENVELHMAIALRREFPGYNRLGKVLCVMDDNDIVKIKIE